MKLDLAVIRTKEELMDWLEENFHFPEHFGRNWDAADKCLRDMGPGDMTLEILNENEISDEMKSEMEMMKLVMGHYLK